MGVPKKHGSGAAWLVVLACLITRLPALPWHAISDDEAIYDVMGREILAGNVMYRDVVDHKPPGLAYTYAALRALASPRNAWLAVHALGLVAVAMTCLGLVGLAKHTLGPELRFMPALLYALVSASKQPADGVAINGELLMNAPLTIALWLALVPETGVRRFGLDVATGVLLAVAALYKYQAGVAGLAVFALLEPKSWAKRIFACGLGVAIPLVMVALYFAHRAALGPAARWGILFNGRYVAASRDLLFAFTRLVRQVAGVTIPAALFYGASGVGLVRLVRARKSRRRRFLLAWTGLSILCVGVGGRFFGHYFLQAEVPLALLAAEPVLRLYERRPRLVLASLLAAPALLAVVVTFPAVSDRIFESGAPPYEAIGAAVRARTTPSDLVWVWGNAPQIYAQAERRAGTRFVFCNYLTGLSPGTASEYTNSKDPSADAVPGAWEMTLRDLDARRPKLILDTAAAGLKGYGKFPIAKYPLLAGYMARHYAPAPALAGIPTYQRLD